jgi:hypothetical protein
VFALTHRRELPANPASRQRTGEASLYSAHPPNIQENALFYGESRTGCNRSIDKCAPVRAEVTDKKPQIVFFLALDGERAPPVPMSAEFGQAGRRAVQQPKHQSLGNREVAVPRRKPSMWNRILHGQCVSCYH